EPRTLERRRIRQAESGPRDAPTRPVTSSYFFTSYFPFHCAQPWNESGTALFAAITTSDSLSPVIPFHLPVPSRNRSLTFIPVPWPPVTMMSPSASTSLQKP